MELLGPNLEDLRAYSGGKFNLQTTLILADQMIARLEYVHDNLYIHRDLKPNNFAIGIGTRLNVLYLIDFGLGMTYKDKLTGTHIVFKDKKEIVGTIRFASVNAHYGMEQSRRDDLESLGYVLVYLIRGALPWQNTAKGTQKRNEDSILQCKVSTSVEKLCTGLPCTFIE
jgi:serine/threonine protein kinase